MEPVFFSLIKTIPLRHSSADISILYSVVASETRHCIEEGRPYLQLGLLFVEKPPSHGRD